MAKELQKVNDPVVENCALTAIIQFLNNLTPEQLAGIGFQILPDSNDDTDMFDQDNDTCITTPEPQKLQRIFDILHNLGISPHLSGFTYLKEAVQLYIDKPTSFSLITKELYPFIAEKYNSTSSRVERAMRHAIESAYQRNAQMRKLFSYKPKNSEFIATIVEMYKYSYKV